jgi:hypothetical protein
VQEKCRRIGYFSNYFFLKMAAKFAPSEGKVIEDKIPREFLFHRFEKNLSGAGRQTAVEGRLISEKLLEAPGC